MSEILTGLIDNLPNAGANPPGVVKKVVFGPSHFAPEENFVVRCYNVDPGVGSTQLHEHPWAHWMIVRKGVAHVIIDGMLDQAVSEGSWIHVPVGVKHTVYNELKEQPLSFFCIVRPEGDVTPAKPSSALSAGGVCG